jgi:hypothetical protein
LGDYDVAQNREAEMFAKLREPNWPMQQPNVPVLADDSDNWVESIVGRIPVDEAFRDFRDFQDEVKWTFHGRNRRS